MKYESCPSCYGSGMEYTGEDIVSCYTCKGNGSIIARDEKGRFMPYKREIFVFGSNVQGRHGKGSAKHAYEFFGAVMGEGLGLFGNSYAIPTMTILKDGTSAKKWKLETLALSQIKAYIDHFMEDAVERTDLEFMITRIGAGSAGYDWDRDIRPLFPEVLPENCKFIDTTPPKETK